MNPWDRLMDWGMRPVDGASVAVFRMLFGLLGLIGILRFFVHDWIAALYVQPAFRFAYWGWDWVAPWSLWGMYTHFLALGGLCLCIGAGIFYRTAIVLFCLGFTYVELLDQTLYLNHYYWVSLISLLMIFMPLDCVMSVKAWQKPRDPGQTAVRQWTIWTLRAQIGVVYFFAGLAKLNADWLLHALPLRIWLSAYGALPVVGPWLQEAWTAYLLSWVGAFFDLTIVGWLLWSRSRPFAYGVLLIFHGLTGLLFPAIGMFPWWMAASALVFFAPDWPRRLWRSLRSRLPAVGLRLGSGRLSRRSVGADHQAPAVLPLHSPAPWVVRAGTGGLCLMFLVQMILPLRHWAYPGNVRWNEEGYFLAWRVMLTEKRGFVEFRVRDPVSGRQWRVAPEDYLTALQTERMALQPDMIRQTAHFIAQDFAARGYDAVEVRADAFVSFNGRPHRRLINPAVDLAAERSGLAPRPWILPYHRTDGTGSRGISGAYPPSPSVSENPTETPNRLTTSVFNARWSVLRLA